MLHCLSPVSPASVITDAGGGLTGIIVFIVTRTDRQTKLVSKVCTHTHTHAYTYVYDYSLFMCVCVLITHLEKRSIDVAGEGTG